MSIEHLQVKAGNRTWDIVRPEDLESLWSKMDGFEDADADFIPYWVEIWPAAILLTEWIQANRALVDRARCLDLGCGLGLTALAGAASGALVTAVDNNSSALSFARLNAANNQVPEPAWICMDWNKPAFVRACFDFVWAADVFYESRFIRPVAKLIDYVLKPDGTVFLADPDREISRRAWPRMSESGWDVRDLAEKKVKSGGQRAKITLRALRRGNLDRS